MNKIDKLKPTIAIIGGAGPDACIDMQIKLCRSMKENINIHSDQDHYRVIVDNNTQLPNRDNALLNEGPSPLPTYIKSIQYLQKMGGDILIIPCNSAHAYFAEMQAVTTMQMINMITATTQFAVKHYKTVKKIGLVASQSTINKRLYHNSLRHYGVEVIIPDVSEQRSIVSAIYGIKAGFTNKTSFLTEKRREQLSFIYQKCFTLGGADGSIMPEVVLPYEILMSVIKKLVLRGAELMILGCTEIPLVIKSSYLKEKIALLDPAKILADTVIQHCAELELNRFINQSGLQIPKSTDFN